MTNTLTNRSFVTAGLLAALFIGALDATVIVTAGPAITAHLDGLSLFSWVFSIYTMATCVMTPIFGKLCDMYGRKTIFIVGVSIFVIGSVLCGSANSMTELIWYRLVQGIGNGALAPVVFTIVGDMYTGKQRAKIQGVFASVWSVASLLGPLIGGFFVDYVSWRWIFYMNVPVGILSIALILKFFKESFEKKRAKVDVAGAVILTVAISSLLFALLSGGNEYDWNSPLILTLFVVSGLSVLAFVFVELRAQEPMVPLRLFQNRVIAVLNVTVFFAYGISTGLAVYLPTWIQSVLGYSATASGFTLMPMSVAWQVGAILVGFLLYRIGAKLNMVLGALFVLAGSLWLTTLQVDSPYWFMIAIVSLIGIGMGYISTPATVLVQSSVGWESRGAATASVSLMNAFGQTVGIAIYGSVLNAYALGGNAGAGATSASSANLAEGLQAVFVAGSVLAVLTLLAVMLLPPHRKIIEQQSKLEPEILE